MLGVPPPLRAVTAAVFDPEASCGFAENAVDGLGSAAAARLPPRVRVSVAPGLSDFVYVVALLLVDEIVITAPVDVAVTPRLERVPFPLIPFFNAVAISVVESPPCTV